MIDINYAKQVFHLERENKILMDKIEEYENLIKLYPDKILVDELIEKLKLITTKQNT